MLEERELAEFLASMMEDEARYHPLRCQYCHRRFLWIEVPGWISYDDAKEYGVYKHLAHCMSAPSKIVQEARIITLEDEG